VINKISLSFIGAFQNVAGSWRHEPGRLAVGGVHRPLSATPCDIL